MVIVFDAWMPRDERRAVGRADHEYGSAGGFCGFDAGGSVLENETFLNGLRQCLRSQQKAIRRRFAVLYVLAGCARLLLGTK